MRALQAEISRHDFSTFLDAEPSFANGGPGIVTPGCPLCKKRFYICTLLAELPVRDAILDYEKAYNRLW